MIAVQVQLSKRRRSIHRERRRLTHNLLYAPLLASLVLPVYRSLSRCERPFWSAPRGDGFWETKVLLNWKNMGQQYPDWEERPCSTWPTTECLKERFGFFVNGMGCSYESKKQTCDSQYRTYAERMAVIFHWLAQSVTFAQLAAMYVRNRPFAVGGATRVAAMLVHK